MGSLIDYMGSFFIAALVLLMFVQLRLYSTNNSFRSDSELQLQQNAKTMATTHEPQPAGTGYSM